MKIKINNLTIEYITKGKGRDLLFLHGGTVSYRIHKKFLETLAQKYKVWAPSLPGAGKSSSLPKRWKFNEYKEIICAFTKINKIEPVLLGHSFGGAVAIDSYSHFPDCFQSLVLCAPAGIPVNKTGSKVFEVAKGGFKGLVGGTSFVRKDIVLNSLFHARDIVKILKMYAQMDLRNQLKKIKDEVLIFWGKDDRVVPFSCLEKLEKCLNKNKSLVFRDRHDFLSRRSAQILKEIDKFCTDEKMIGDN